MGAQQRLAGGQQHGQRHPLGGARDVAGGRERRREPDVGVGRILAVGERLPVVRNRVATGPASSGCASVAPAEAAGWRFAIDDLYACWFRDIDRALDGLLEAAQQHLQPYAPALVDVDASSASSTARPRPSPFRRRRCLLPQAHGRKRLIGQASRSGAANWRNTVLTTLRASFRVARHRLESVGPACSRISCCTRSRCRGLVLKAAHCAMKRSRSAVRSSRRMTLMRRSSSLSSPGRSRRRWWW